MNSINQINNYFCEKILDLEEYSKDGKPWIFLCASAFLEYLTKMVYNKKSFNGNDYKNFIKDYLSKINQNYRLFRFKNGSQDLPEQMFHVLRCGIVHNFSLIPDHLSKSKGGRERSIALAHRSSGYVHLQNYKSAEISDACILIAEQFIEDIKNVINYIFKKAKTDKDLKMNIKSWINKCPPITGGF